MLLQNKFGTLDSSKDINLKNNSKFNLLNKEL